jgi:transcriptional regulator with XRE-family HTH domain
MGLNQSQLAEALGINRSNVAAYESKGVEPRLKTILSMAKFFDITVTDLLDTKLDESTEYNPYDNNKSNTTIAIDSPLKNDDNITEFINKSVKITKVLEGFKSFYSFKKKSMTQSDPEKEKLMHDIDNFINLMEHLLSYNKTVINTIGGTSKA